MYKFGPTQQKLLILLVGGLILSFEKSPAKMHRNLWLLAKEWKKVNQQSLYRSVQRLSSQKLLEKKSLPNGSCILVLTKEGKRQARIQQLFGSSIRFKNKKDWDKKWRVILFDIPEKSRRFRGILREHLYELKFYKLQQSVFVSPYPCEKQLAELVSLYKAEAFVRLMTVDWVDNEERLRKHFFSLSPKKSCYSP